MTDKSELPVEAMRAATLEYNTSLTGKHFGAAERIIRAYLALAPQAPVSAVPVAYRFSDGGGYNADWRYSTYDPREYDHVVEESGASCLGSVTPLYASPPPPAQADDGKGLTGLDRLRLHVTDPDTFSVGYDDIDDALKEIDECLSAYVPLIRELVAALKEVKPAIDVMETMTSCGSDDDWIWGLQEKIASALTKAKAAGYAALSAKETSDD